MSYDRDSHSHSKDHPTYYPNARMIGFKSNGSNTNQSMFTEDKESLQTKLALQELSKRVLDLESQVSELNRLKVIKLQDDINQIKQMVNVLAGDYQHRKAVEDDLK